METGGVAAEEGELEGEAVVARVAKAAAVTASAVAEALGAQGWGRGEGMRAMVEEGEEDWAGTGLGTRCMRAHAA